MNRRSFLVAAAALGAGCIGDSARSNSSTETTDTPQSTQTTTQPMGSTNKTTTNTPQLNGSRSLTLTNLSQGNLGKSGLKADATLLTDTVTTQHPARIKLDLSASSKTTVSFRICRPGDIHEATNIKNDEKLILKEGQPRQQTSDCWRISQDQLFWGRPCYTKTVTITPDSPFTREFTIWDHPDNSTCFPTGTYHVKDTPKQNDEVLHWSFDIQVSK